MTHEYSGIEDLRNLPQDTRPAAEVVLQEQKHGDEFRPVGRADIDRLMTRYNDLDKQKSAVLAKLYGAKDMTSKTPPYLQQQELRMELEMLDAEYYSVMHQLDTLSRAYLKQESNG